MLVNELKNHFGRVFQSSRPPLVTSSPGRVNIIGEHTDYNEGFVLPAAIDKAIYVAVEKRDDGLIHLYSAGFDAEYKVQVSDIAPVDGWPTYVLGVVDQLIKRGFYIGGFNLALDGDVPLGAGLSSSAAVECATVFALNELLGLQLSKMEMVQVAQKAEHEYAGVKCGIMDQFASMFGKENYVIRLDCRSLEYEYVPLDLKGYKILLLNTNVKHSLSSSEYNTRRSQCEQGVALVQKAHPSVSSLRDVTMPMLEEFVAPVDQTIFRRCKYVVEEKDRLLNGCEDLKNGNIQALGEKMFQTHQGLSKEYEVSCGELDFLVDYVKDNTAVLGARMMGGGFGGCTINLVEESALDELITGLRPAYEKAFGKKLDYYLASIKQGTSLVEPLGSAEHQPTVIADALI